MTIDGYNAGSPVTVIRRFVEAVKIDRNLRRILFGNEPEDLSAGLERITRVLSGLPGGGPS